MTALAKYPAKGTTVLQYVSAAYVALSGLTSVDVSGEKSNTMDSTDLATTKTETKIATGYNTAPTIKLEGLYDPAHPTYTNLAAILTSQAPTNFKVTYPDIAPTSAVYSVVGVGIDKKAAKGSPLMASVTLETSGDPA